MKHNLLSNNDIGKHENRFFVAKMNPMADAIDTDLAEVLLAEILHKYGTISISQLRKSCEQEIK